MMAYWAGAALLLLATLVAMQFSDEVNWSISDFLFAGLLLGGTGLAFELILRKSPNSAYRTAFGMALAAAFLLIWLNGAVGIIGSEDNDANLMYGGVLAVAAIGSLIARFRPRGMALAMFAAALAMALVAGVAIIAGLGTPESGLGEILFLTGFFAQFMLISAWLFRKAAQGEPERGYVSKFLSLLTMAIGFEMLMFMIIVESEPGAIPLLLILLGAGWFFLARARARAHAH